MPKFIADLHIHSKYSRATSPLLTPEHLEYWAKIKGIQVMGTGDCIHPVWLNELETKLESSENGLYTLKKEYQLPETKNLSNVLQEKPVYFMPTTEISNIYKKNNKTRKVHNICILPDFDTVRIFQAKIEEIGNIRSDGRPILGLDSKILLEMLLESGNNSYLIPAHIWTPWFSVLGSKSGFDSIEECYEDLSSEIFALETGLSSDPPMNRICSFLDKYRLVSNSDAHSPDKLGREANVFDVEIGYNNIYNALKNDKGFIGTIEFFPDEGKYHNDGHRDCKINWTPLETVQHNNLCSTCGKPVTKGVMYRVAELADRTDPSEAKSKQTFWSITPLAGLLAELDNKKNPRSKAITEKYFHLINSLGSELDILLTTDLKEIAKISGTITAEAINRLREGFILTEGGYDGEFGKVHLFHAGEIQNYKTNSLFSQDKASIQKEKYSSLTFDIQQFKELKKNITSAIETTNSNTIWTYTEQEEAIAHKKGPCLLLAGPGTGKTRILTKRIISLINNGVNSSNILAFTFSNKAAEEMSDNVNKKISKNNCTISTFHKLGLTILREELSLNNNEKFFGIIDESKQISIIQKLFDADHQTILNNINNNKQSKLFLEKKDTIVERYNQELRKINALDINDLIYLTVEILINNPKTLAKYQKKFQWILVDEFQEISAIQYQLIELLSNKQNLFVAGDSDQAVYSSKGTKKEPVNSFIGDYTEARLISLSKSYRCPNAILKGASYVIKKSDEIQREDDGALIVLKEFSTDGAEAQWIAAEIEQLVGGSSNFPRISGASNKMFEDEISFKDIAILCRTKHLFPPIIKALNSHQLPVQTINTDSILQDYPYKEIIIELKNTYFGLENQVSKVSKEVLSMFENGMSLAFILRRICIEHDITSEQQRILEKVAKPYKNKYTAFFDDISLKTGIDEYNKHADNIALMTIHASKGLDFKYVFIPGCESKIMPFQLFNKKNKDELKEEANILYVAMTRATDKLFMTYASKRKLLNKTIKGKLSPLVKGIPEELLNKEKVEVKNKKSVDQLSLF